MANEFRQSPDGVALENNHVHQLQLSWMGAGGRGVPLRQTSVSDAALYAVAARNRGTGGLHIQATHSSGTHDLFNVTDAGVLLSTAGGPAEAIGPEVGDIKLVFRVLGDWSAKWALCDGTNGTPDMRGRFPIGAGGAYALDDTGGFETYNLAHAHSGPSHAHGANTGSGGTSATGSGGPASTDNANAGSTALGGALSTDNTAVTTNLGGAATTNNAGGFSGNTQDGGTISTDNAGSFSGNTGDSDAGETGPTSDFHSVTDTTGVDQTNVADTTHTHTTSDHNHGITIGSHDHDIADHDHALDIGSHDHPITQHQHAGPSHDHDIAQHSHTMAGTHDHNLVSHAHSGPSHDHAISADGTAATGSGGSPTQSAMPPYKALYFIMRIAA